MVGKWKLIGRGKKGKGQEVNQEGDYFKIFAIVLDGNIDLI